MAGLNNLAQSGAAKVVGTHRGSEAAPRKVTILGSTGSVGVSTLDLIEHSSAIPHEREIVVEALTANANVELLAEQARKFNPKFVAIGNEEKLPQLRDLLGDTDIEIAGGTSGICEAAQRDADWVMAAIVGAAGLAPTLEAAKRGAAIALANKECLVCAGDVLMAKIRDAGGSLLPVDSEHNAMFQVFDFERPERVTRLILTASGGPFRTWDAGKMENATPAQAVAHPNWSMGAKISVDSATMMNKGLELIEAAHIFPVHADNIEILVHPQSVIHSMVEYIDGSVLAQLGTPDMRTPIASTLAWPDRMSSPSAKLDFTKNAELTFEAPDETKFPALRLIREVVAKGGAYPAILNASNEIAVEAFLGERIKFGDIARVTQSVLDKADQENWPSAGLSTIEDVIEADTKGRSLAQAVVKALAS